MSFEFNKHRSLEGTHAYLSPSQHSWLHYSDDKMREVYENQLMKQRGTDLHAFAEMANHLGITMPNSKKTLNAFINDGLKYEMNAEVLLYYSPFCYGTADLIGFDQKKHLLRVFDLKTGRRDILEFGQLHVYCALFCLEYGFSPLELTYDCRLYQNDEVRIEDPTEPEEIKDVMETIIHLERIVSDMQSDAKRNRAIL